MLLGAMLGRFPSSKKFALPPGLGRVDVCHGVAEGRFTKTGKSLSCRVGKLFCCLQTFRAGLKTSQSS